jgi:hypothetical protein
MVGRQEGVERSGVDRVDRRLAQRKRACLACGPCPGRLTPPIAAGQGEGLPVQEGRGEFEEGDERKIEVAWLVMGPAGPRDGGARVGGRCLAPDG